MICRAIKHCFDGSFECMQPHIEGMDSFPGLQMHCHNFRHSEPLRDQRVLIVGASFSGASSCHMPHDFSVPVRSLLLIIEYTLAILMADILLAEAPAHPP